MNISPKIRFWIQSVPGWFLFEIPAKLIRGKTPYRLPRSITWTCPHTGRKLTARALMLYDQFTYSPNLYQWDGEPSEAAPLHDAGWNTGLWDNGDAMSFDEINDVFEYILWREGHSPRVVRRYCRAVRSDVMRAVWRRRHGVWRATLPT